MSTYDAASNALSKTSAQMASNDIRQLVVSRLGEGSYGLDIQTVREINRLIDITPIPQALEFVDGIINLRGSIIPVVNLGQRFNLDRTGHSKDARIVVIENGANAVSPVVDKVSKVLRLPVKDIDPPPNLSSNGIDLGFIQGVGKIDGEIILILSMGNLLSAEGQAQLTQVAQG